MRTTPLAVAGLLLSAPAAFAAEPGPVGYVKQVRHLLQERCFACHGTLQQKGGLRLDGGANILKGGTSGPAVVPGKPADSELIARVTSTDDSDRMPPEGIPLKPEEVAALKAWVQQGAKFPADDKPEPDPRDHWAFRTPVRPAVPATGNSKLEARNPIDAFVAATRAEKGLTPAGPADKRVLLRRVYLDLIGLPPTAEQTAAFLADSSPNAYETVVDSLLASPQYGERWGRHFLDVWRYSDWWGLGAQLRNSQKHIWRWRDWTVDSFNADVGYDEMLRQMLAADELYPTDPKKLAATGYLARSYFLFNRSTWLEEVVEHAGKGLLGLTVNCAKCHDHKYDPVSQVDYYRLRAVFEPYQVRTDMVGAQTDFEKDGLPRAFDCNADAKTPFFIRGDERNPDPSRTITPGLPGFLLPAGLKVEEVKLPPAAYAPASRPEVVAAYRAAAEEKLKAARGKSAAAVTAAEAAVAAVDARAAAERAKAAGGDVKALARAAAKAEKLAAVLAAEAALEAAPAAGKAAAQKALAAAKAAAANPGEAYTPLRGAVKAAESNVEPEANRNKPFPATSTGRRTAFAKWVTDKSNPLTARVAVNHVWARHFGRPLVPTVFEFGRKGTPPTHPELLDWLAVELMENNWSLKHLHRLMVTSGTYRMSSSSAGGSANAAADPENRYLWRMNAVRMEAQAVRDSLLHLAGELDLTMGGPPVPAAAQDASRRRSMYFFHSHNDHNKLLGIFDDANVLDCYRRTESIVPQQALALANSKLSLAMAEKITAKVAARVGPAAADPAFVTAAFETVLGGTPTAAERAACEEALAELRAAAADLPEPARVPRARLQLVQALLNHNDFVTVR